MIKNNTFSLKELSPPHKCVMCCESAYTTVQTFWVGKIFVFDQKQLRRDTAGEQGKKTTTKQTNKKT